jgi:pilus assembly protein CpaB
MRRKSTLLIIAGFALLLLAGGMAVLTFARPSQAMLSASEPSSPTAEPMVPVVVAEIDIEPGTIITATNELLSVNEIRASQFNNETNITNIEDARNMVANTSIKAGEPVLRSFLRPAGLAEKIPEPEPGQPSLKAFPIQVNSLSGVADLIQPGDFIDVVASFNLDVVTFHPGAPQQGENGPVSAINERATNEGASKVLLQDIEVLEIVRPAAVVEGSAEQAPPPEGEEGANPPPPTAANALSAGNWLLVIAVTNDEAEVLRFVLDRGIGLTSILRRTNDHTTERTVGATMRILNEVYGMPVPSFPQVVRQSGAAVEGVPQLAPVDVQPPVTEPAAAAGTP